MLPIFNQASIVRHQLKNLVGSFELPFDLVLIDDGSEDSTLAEIEGFVLMDLPSLKTKLSRLSVYRYSSSRFETACDAFGLEVSRTRYVFEVQADMFIHDHGWDARLVELMRHKTDIIAISGRGVEPAIPVWEDYARTLGSDIARAQGLAAYAIIRAAVLAKRLLNSFIPKATEKSLEAEDMVGSVESNALIYPPKVDFEVSGRAGFLGPLIARAESIPNQYKGRIWIGETVMRGPLLVDKSKVAEAGQWPSDKFFQGFDEHYLWLRARVTLGYKVAFSPVSFSSPLQLGSMRKQRSLKSEILILLNLLRIRRPRRTVLNDVAAWTGIDSLITVPGKRTVN